jgi:transposase
MSTLKIRRSYDAQFKKDSVRHLMTSGRSVTEVADELGIDRSNLGKWRQEHLKKMDGESVESEIKPSDMDAENRRLRIELSHVREQRDILKKAISIFSQEDKGRMSS